MSRSLSQRATLKTPAESATFARRPANTLGRLGDSLTAQSYYEDAAGSPPVKVVSNRGYGAWGLALVGQRLQVTHEAGIGGQTTTDILARTDAFLAAGVPAWVDLQAGTNDLLASASATTITTNLDAILTKLLNAGCRVILRTLPPINTITGGRFTLIQVNNWIRRQALTRPGILLVDWTAKLSQNDGTWVPAYTTDGIHPNPVGAVVMAKIWADVVSKNIPNVDVLPQYGSDPESFVTNPMMNGTAGTLASTASGDGSTGTVADGWRYDRISGTVISTLSSVARTDGVSGKWQQINLTTGSSATASGRLTFRTASAGAANTNGLSYAAGDKVYGLVEMQLGTDIVSAAAKYIRVTAAAVNTSFTDVFQSKAFDVDPANSLPGGTDSPTDNMVFATPPFTIPATGTQWLELRVDQTAKGTIRVGRAGLWKVGTGPLYQPGYSLYYAVP
jgi:lysophospholipase L1-like esterase